uniref:Uncharacterized protein n=1 Tax=Rousettus aegyptiacus TaxID=9407 RepID=A0A7J8C4C1_ROUAE|nr:hypothetical protein HJG63_018375 [Rousettus aegyptiacus]
MQPFSSLIFLCVSEQQRYLFLWELLLFGHLSFSQKAPAGLPGLSLSTPVHREGQGRAGTGSHVHPHGATRTHWLRESCIYCSFLGKREMDSPSGRVFSCLRLKKSCLT